ncbi:hypothetical protein LCGC14_0742950 [marine sediment metagenome]|uniref:Uncharacterized protein n=1 Tax=marine sediment metagenome TaxID=412755 RepID=A0A0F9Q670_9ZZZZ
MKHIDKEEIIEMLNSGESVRGIEAKLKKKYPNNKSMWLSSVTLQKFRKDNLQLEGRVLKDIQEAGRSQKQQLEEKDRQKSLEASGAYKKKLNEIVDSKLDVARKILQLDAVIETRMEYWFNAVASGEESASKGDKELRQFIDRQIVLLGQYKKFVEGMADKTIDYNVNITVMNEQIGIIRDVIRECIADFESEKAMLFMERLNKRLENTSYRPQEIPEPVKLEDLHEAEFELVDGDPKND